MNYLFFFVHPSKVKVFKNTINALKEKGNNVEILITKKDVLEDLVIHEGWTYKNIFPRGRKIKYLPGSISLIIYFFLTIVKLYLFTRGKKYDLFITDDLLVYIGKLRKIPSIAFTDDDLKVTKKFSMILKYASSILAPDITDLEKYNYKKIGFNSYKELGFLHPKYFTVDKNIINKYVSPSKKYFIIRLVNLGAYHDIGRNGLLNENVLSLINLLSKYGQVFISAERNLKKEFEPYRLKVKSSDFIHLLGGADIYIGDSQTMASEASILGVPTFRINDFKGEISVMNEKEEKYKLSRNYKSDQFDLMFNDLKDLLNSKGYKAQYMKKAETMWKDKIDLSNFMFWIFKNYPKSVEEYFSNPTIQNNYRFD